MDPHSTRSAPTGAQPGADADADDRTLLPLPGPAGTAPRMPAPAPAARAPDSAGSDDATLFLAPAGTRLPCDQAPAAAPVPVPVPDDDRTLFGAGPAPADEAATVLVPAEAVVPWLRMPAPGAEPTTVSRLQSDEDRTLLAAPDADGTALRMPAPGGQATAVQSGPLPAAAAPARTPRAGVELQRLVAGVNPLLGAASVLLALVAQLRASGTHADPDALREQLLAHMADFEAQAAASGVARPRVTAARYLLCSFLDEVIAATPWGQGCWEARTLLNEFHEERWGGAKAFELLEKLGEDPAANAEVLELFYVCLALGFEGRWRGRPDARARLDAIADRVLQSVRPAAAAQPAGGARSLSLRWQGVSAPQRPGLHLPPLWSVAVLAGALVLAALLAFQWRLAAQARPLLRELHALPAALQPARAAAAADAPAAAARLAPLLQADAAAGALAVRDERLRSVVTLPADALFKDGTELRPGAAAVIGRVARALRGLPGQVNVIGHSDDSSAASLQFPSNWHLSRARAQAVLDELARQDVPALRLHAEGRADAEPLSAGHTAEDRARNRRVEIELRLPRPQGAESGG